jgi:hypothetical protein
MTLISWLKKGMTDAALAGSTRTTWIEQEMRDPTQKTATK